ncbi:hypothetical protein DFS34DRAFT_601129 [Phlyctochytrium arcticum]|nr:hypothetical protein DFS34DRAFT_601129 [Phlyctochytrium arcticum]
MSSSTRTNDRVRRQASFVSDESGPAASTASHRRRRDDTIRKNAEKDVAVRKPVTRSSRPVQKTSAKNLKLASTQAAAAPTPPASAPASPPSDRRTSPTSPTVATLPPVPGTVSSMNPEPAVVLQSSAKVTEAAAYMAAKRQDAVLIVDKSGHLVGILTDKDLAYRVVARGLDPRTTTVLQVMTKNPVSVTSTSNATDALNKMVAGQFRHLPVVESDDESSEDDGMDFRKDSLVSNHTRGKSSLIESHVSHTRSGGVVGILDITKCLYEALEKLDRAYESSRQLNEALKGVEREWSIGSGSIGRYAEALRDQLACPDLAGLLASQSASPPVVSLRASVFEAADIMRQSQETAVLVFDVEGGHNSRGVGTLAGIFTSKDLVLRVLAGGLDPAATSVLRVMTPHPDCVTPETPVVDALRKMHAGRYLHLPVVDDSGVVEGLVDVLKLTYTTLNQMTNIQGEPGEGPMWSRFWDSTLNPMDMAYGNGRASPGASDQRSQSTRGRGGGDYAFNDDSTVAPDDSASMFPSPEQQQYTHMDSPESNSGLGTSLGLTTLLAEGVFVFKIRDVTNGQTHRFTAPSNDLARLQAVVAHRLQLQVSSPFSISFIDDEGDIVHMRTNQDLQDAVVMAHAGGWGRLVLSIDGQQGKAEVDQLNSMPDRVFSKSREKETSPRSGGGGGYLGPLMMGSGIAVVCAFLLGRNFHG